MSASDSPNAEMIEFWNAQMGAVWSEAAERIDRFLGDYGTRARGALGLSGGERVLDVGCGCGDSTLRIARAVGETGRAIGLDVSRPMLAIAEERAARSGLGGRTEWREADAQTAALGEAELDAVYSRFGVMFFESPGQAFANLARAARPGGRLAFVCWQQREANVWMTAPARAAAPLIELPPPAEDDAPGPFGLARPDRLQQLLARAGWRGVELQALDEALCLGETMDEALDLITTVGPVGGGLRQSRAPGSVRERVRDAVRGALEPFAGASGVCAPAAAWLVTAAR